MKHSTSLFAASETMYDTKLGMQFKLFLGKVAAYNGEIPLTRAEIKKELGVSLSALKRLISEFLHTGLLYEKNNRLFMNQSMLVDYKENSNDEYVKYFKFLSSEAFKKADRRTQRFVLDMLSTRVYLQGRTYVSYVKHMLINSSIKRKSGQFNVRTVGEMKTIIEQAAEFLDLELKQNDKGDWLVVVKGIKSDLLAQGAFDSEGAVLWVSQKMYEAGFVFEVVNTKVKEQLSKVMEYYYDQLGFEMADSVFCDTLKILSDNATFHSMIYSDAEEESQLNEISAYFRKVAETSERYLAEKLTMSYEQFYGLVEKVEILAHEDGCNPDHLEEVKQAKAIKKHLREQLYRIENMWIQQFHAGKTNVYENTLQYNIALRYMKDLHSLLDIQRKSRYN